MEGVFGDGRKTSVCGTITNKRSPPGGRRCMICRPTRPRKWRTSWPPRTESFSSCGHMMTRFPSGRVMIAQSVGHVNLTQAELKKGAQKSAVAKASWQITIFSVGERRRDLAGRRRRYQYAWTSSRLLVEVIPLLSLGGVFGIVPASWATLPHPGFVS